MPMLDMPLEKLVSYQGTNPKPEDFDRYWEEALRQLDGLDPELEVNPAAFQTAAAECMDMTFTGVGGARIYAQYLRPRQAPAPHPAVLLFHGYSGNSGDWSEKLPYTAVGHSVLALDVRGQGGRSEDPGGVRGNTLRGHIIRGLDDDPRRLLYRQVFLDTVQLARIAMGLEEVDPARVGCTGGSQGGALTLACAALEPRIRRAAAAFPFLCDYQRAWEMDMVERAYVELREYFRRFDPTHAREPEIFRRLGYIDIQHLAPRIRGEVLMFTALQDNVCPPSTQFAAFNKIESPKEMVLYPDFGHEALPGARDRIHSFLSQL